MKEETKAKELIDTFRDMTKYFIYMILELYLSVKYKEEIFKKIGGTRHE